MTCNVVLVLLCCPLACLRLLWVEKPKNCLFIYILFGKCICVLYHSLAIFTINMGKIIIIYLFFSTILYWVSIICSSLFSWSCRQHISLCSHSSYKHPLRSFENNIYLHCISSIRYDINIVCACTNWIFFNNPQCLISHWWHWFIANNNICNIHYVQAFCNCCYDKY